MGDSEARVLPARAAPPNPHRLRLADFVWRMTEDATKRGRGIGVSMGCGRRAALRCSTPEPRATLYTQSRTASKPVAAKGPLLVLSSSDPESAYWNGQPFVEGDFAKCSRFGCSALREGAGKPCASRS